MSDDKKLTGKEHAIRALAAGSQGVRDTALPGAAGLGLLAMRPYFRKVMSSTGHVPPAFKTDTVDKLLSLADKLVRAGGRDPDVGRPLELELKKTPGFSGFFRETRKAPGESKLRDMLQVGLHTTPESLAHEAGHLTTGNRFGKALSSVSPLLRRYPAHAIPSLLAATALLADPDKETPMIAKAAPYVGGAQLAAILGEEVRANVRALKLLKQIGYKTPLSQQVGRHALALSYLPRAAILVGAPLGILAGVKAYDEARKKKRPMPVKGLLSMKPTTLAATPSPEEIKEKWAPRFK